MNLRPEDIRGLTPQEIAERFSPADIQATLAQINTSRPREESGDITAYNPDADFFSSENMGAMASNIVPSAVKMGEDIYNAATSPIETAKAVYEAGPSGILSALGERFGSLDALKRTAVEDPFGLALDVAPGFQLAGRGLKAVGMGGRAAAALEGATPVRATARAGRGLADAAGTGVREMSSVLSGKDPGVFSTARRALAPNMDELTETFRRGGRVAEDVASERAQTFAKSQRRAFADARSGAEVDAIPEAAAKVEAEINRELGQIAEAGKARFQNVPIDPDSYFRFVDDLQGELGKYNVRMTPEGVDLSQSAMWRDPGAAREIGDALDAVFEPLSSGQPTLGDVWLARRRIDEASGSLLARKAGFGGQEEAVLKSIKKSLNDYLESVDNPDFKQFNADYASGAALRERFAREFTGVGGAGKSPEAQINAIVRSIKEGRGSSEAFLTRVEAQTGVPLRAIAAGKELSDILPSGLIGRSLFAGAAFGTAAGMNPTTLFLLFATSPRVLGRTMQGMGIAERQIQKATAVANTVMNIPGARALAEQGLNFGSIVQQLEREGLLENQQPTLMSRIGSAANR